MTKKLSEDDVIELWGVSCKFANQSKNAKTWSGQERTRPNLAITAIQKTFDDDDPRLREGDGTYWRINVEWFNGGYQRHIFTYCDCTLDDARKGIEKEFRLFFEGAKMISGRFI